jgi:hypothetical protein
VYDKKKSQTEKNIERVQNKQQDTNRQKKNKSEIEFDLQQIIIQNGFRIVIVTITKIPFYINPFQ